MYDRTIVWSETSGRLLPYRFGEEPSEGDSNCFKISDTYRREWRYQYLLFVFGFAVDLEVAIVFSSGFQIKSPTWFPGLE